jgi:nucleoside-diphosphate-sugar epimerase
VAQDVLTEEMEPHPTDAYGRSKLEAEKGLAELGLDWAALRPVLVYGQGVKGNMAALLKLAQSPWPLPLGGLKARRSLLSLDNLTAALDTLLKAEGALRRPFIAADPEPVTIPEIIAALRKGFGRGSGLVPVPSFALGAAAALMGKAEAYERLSGALVASPAALKALGWQPVNATPDGLARLAQQASETGAAA